MKQTLILILILILTLISCKEEVTEEVANQQEQQIGISFTSYQIDFDEAEYYSYEELDFDKLWAIQDKEKKDRTEQEVLLLNFAYSYTISLTDTLKLAKLNKIGYKKINFPKSKYGLLKKYFKKDHYFEETACDHVYRDILVLKTNNQTTHFMKICFSCMDTQKATKSRSGRLYLSYYHYLEKLLKGED